ncbi:sigma-70 family RNA polymerase sigma factor [Bacillus salacetis]|uniref:sigma-70 family RNA polymerase sigma factor n=1 Tax=Bacillus salacetis TaxID=2315464 RepID=UPI003B9EF486
MVNEMTIDEVIDQYGAEVWRLVFSYVRDEQLADDLTQEIFIKVFHKLDTFAGQSSLLTWIWRIAANHCKDYLKSWYKRKVFTRDESTFNYMVSSTSVEKEIIQSEEDRELETAVMNLPLKYREIIYLYYYEELPIKEIAQLLNVKENTVKTRLRRAKQLIKKRLVNP